MFTDIQGRVLQVHRIGVIVCRCSTYAVQYGTQRAVNNAARRKGGRCCVPVSTTPTTRNRVPKTGNAIWQLEPMVMPHTKTPSSTFFTADECSWWRLVAGGHTATSAVTGRWPSPSSRPLADVIRLATMSANKSITVLTNKRVGSGCGGDLGGEHRMWRSILYTLAHTLHVYTPFVNRGELNTHALVTTSLATIVPSKSARCRSGVF